MSDEQDDFLSFSAAPIPAPQPKPPKIKQKSTTKKSGQSSRRQTSQSSTVYGDELFQAAWKPEKSVVVCFHPFTKNYIRFSKDEYAGRFAIKYNIHTDGKLLLYYFDPPFDWEFNPEAEFEIKVDDSVRVYGPYDEIDKIKLKVMAIIRREVLLNKKKTIQELTEFEAAVKAAEEQLEEDKEKIEEQLVEAGIFAPERIEKVIEVAIELQKESNEAHEKLVEENAKVVKDKTGTTMKLTPIVY